MAPTENSSEISSTELIIDHEVGKGETLWWYLHKACSFDQDTTQKIIEELKKQTDIVGKNLKEAQNNNLPMYLENGDLKLRKGTILPAKNLKEAFSKAVKNKLYILAEEMEEAKMKELEKNSTELLAYLQKNYPNYEFVRHSDGIEIQTKNGESIVSLTRDDNGWSLEGTPSKVYTLNPDFKGFIYEKDVPERIFRANGLKEIFPKLDVTLAKAEEYFQNLEQRENETYSNLEPLKAQILSKLDKIYAKVPNLQGIFNEYQKEPNYTDPNKIHELITDLSRANIKDYAIVYAQAIFFTKYLNGLNEHTGTMEEREERLGTLNRTLENINNDLQDIVASYSKEPEMLPEQAQSFSQKLKMSVALLMAELTSEKNDVSFAKTKVEKLNVQITNLQQRIKEEEQRKKQLRTDRDEAPAKYREAVLRVNEASKDYAACLLANKIIETLKTNHNASFKTIKFSKEKAQYCIITNENQELDLPKDPLELTTGYNILLNLPENLDRINQFINNPESDKNMKLQYETTIKERDDRQKAIRQTSFDYDRMIENLNSPEKDPGLKLETQLKDVKKNLAQAKKELQSKSEALKQKTFEQVKKLIEFVAGEKYLSIDLSTTKNLKKDERGLVIINNDKSEITILSPEELQIPEIQGLLTESGL
ncbi:MAG: hypothetical protein UR28_C0013G0018 [Candidatus Peregrinibacteria bacterium GW2011_GWF2_33_10]|nr:MAG: hypothetical protein UR28_C0013G0018 [Candidatus Peregrinibacteria bacterium GW2011_GWF2_33_10]OGJ45750.1 MAG: hypothetical protein A2263_01080 [Candidatus Peregrinibacteria bacterium RIFOXYA2_FULL_33_21]OGJ46810.1 MAG: hypothetical protein A2272_00680 [Candidatus Peregrinibacteria bacterium RIFOXYA12_FULL_33_12]OGJ51280.1 MAG: hypothetical protein A2307_00355 [Candidatus Peregrinibacteria bacterium RIFOXYB2_FULL_33_20]